MTDPLRFLIVDDNAADRALVARALRGTWPDASVAEAADVVAARQAMGAGTADVVITDYWLAGATGLDVLAAVRSVWTDAPVIMVTGTGNEEVAVEAMKAGFTDYILKKPSGLARLPSSVTAAVAARNERRARAAAEVALEESRSFLDALITQAPDLVYVFDVDTRRVTFVNRRIESMLGYTPAEIVGLGEATIATLLPPDEAPRIVQKIRELTEPGDDLPVEEEFRVLDKGANERWLRGRACVFRRDPDGRVRQLLATALDVTEEHLANERAQLLTEALRAAADAIVITSRAGTIQWVNPAFTRLTGFTLEEAVGQTPRILSSGRQDPRYYRTLWDTVVSGRVWRGRLINRRKDGTEYVEEMSVTPVSATRQGGCAPDGPTHFIAIKQDVTAQVEQEERLRRSEERFQLALSGANLGLWDDDLADGTTYLTPEWAAQLGFTLDELMPVESAWWELVHPADRDAARAAYAAHVAGEIPYYEAEYRMTNRAGGWTWVHARGQVMERDPAGRALRVTGTYRDITAQKDREELIRAKDEQLRHAQRIESIGQLAGGVAHDFNNLLTAILGYVDLVLSETPESDSRYDDLIEIRNAGDRAADLTQQLLAFSRRQVLTPSTVTVGRIVTGIERMLRRLIREDVQMEIDAAAETPPVRVDVGQVEQVLVNLVVNAADAMPDGGRLRITTSARDVDDAFVRAHPGARPGRYAQIEVADNGTGMDSDVLDQIFEPFFTTKPKGQGTGLGLSVVYGIVKQSGGLIWAVSQPGAGTTFTILLPEAAAGADDRPAPAAGSVPDLVRRARILVVDDDEGVGQLVEKVLRRRGHEVRYVRSGAEAERCCTAWDDRVDLLLIDVVMPDGNGRDLAHRLARRLPNCRIVMMSGYDDQRIRARAAGPSEQFLAKPFDPATLAHLVADLFAPEAELQVSSGVRAEGE